MSKSKIPDYSQYFIAALNAANTPSATTTALEGDINNTLNWARGGDYRNPPHNAFLSLEDPAKAEKRRELVTNAGDLGISALGSLNGGAQKLIAENDKNNFAQEEQGNYQNQVANAFHNATNAAMGISQQDQQRRLGILGSTTGLASAQLNQPKQTPWWQSLVQGLAGGASAAAV